MDRYIVLAAELGEHDSDSRDFYVAGKESHEVASSKSLPQLHADAVRLRDSLMADHDRAFVASRREFLLRQVNSLVFRIEQLQGVQHSFREESRSLFGVEVPEADQSWLRARIRREVERLIGSGRKPADAYSRYEAQFVVRPERVPAVFEAALQACRRITREHVAMPMNEQVRVEYVSQKPWSAFSRYLGDSRSVIQVNIDYPLTVDRLLNLACHEGYPGHHVFNLLRDQQMVQDGRREEFRVQPTFSPQSYVSEGAAAYAPTLALSAAERIRIERHVLLPLAGLKVADVPRYVHVEQLIASLHTAEPAIARDYLDGTLEFARAAKALEDEMLMEHSETMLLYLNEFRTYMLTYTLGMDQVAAYVGQGNPQEPERWRRYLRLVQNPDALTAH